MDGAIFSISKAARVRVLIGDSEGQVEAALSMKFPFPLGPLETEAKALEEGVQFAGDLGI